MSEVNKNLSEILNTDYVPVVSDKSDKPVTIHQSEEINPDAWMFNDSLKINF